MRHHPLDATSARHGDTTTMADPGAPGSPTQPGPDSAVSAALILDALTALNQDARLRELLRGAPVLSLSVQLTEGRPVVELSPQVALGAAERSEARAIVQQRIAEAAERARPRRARGSEDPGPRRHAVAARRHLQADDPERALQVAEEALQRWPDSVDLLAYRAMSLADMGQLRRAAEAFGRVIRRDPESVFAHASAAQLLARLGRWQSALAYARSALALDPDDVASLQVLALANEHLGAYRQAADAMRRALELDPTVPNGTEDLARMEEATAHDFEVDLVDARPVQPAPRSTADLPTTDPDFGPGAASSSGSETEVEAAGALPPVEHLVTRQPASWGRAARPSAAGATVDCPHCGRSNPSRVSFCLQCGNRLESAG